MQVYTPLHAFSQPLPASPQTLPLRLTQSLKACGINTSDKLSSQPSFTVASERMQIVIQRFTQVPSSPPPLLSSLHSRSWPFLYFDFLHALPHRIAFPRDMRKNLLHTLTYTWTDTHTDTHTT